MEMFFVFQSSPDFCVELLVSNTRISDPSQNVILDIWSEVSSGCESIELSAPPSQTQVITFSGDNRGTVKYREKKTYK